MANSAFLNDSKQYGSRAIDKYQSIIWPKTYIPAEVVS